MTLILFDIDGTLLSCRGAGKRAMTRAGRALFGDAFSLDGVDLGGRLDPHILAEAAEKSGVTVDDTQAAAFFDAYLPLLAEELTDVIALPGTGALLDALAHTDATLGLLTGNVRAAAPLKLRAAGLPFDRFSHGAFGDEGPTRPALAALAFERFRAHPERRSTAPERVLVVGDTPHDVHCATENGFAVVAVATGRADVATLRAAGAHVVVEDLRDPSPVLEFVNAAR